MFYNDRNSIVCVTNVAENDADIYQLPYEDILPNPTLEQIRDVVCVRKIRPTLSSRWQTHSVSQLSNVSCSCLMIVVAGSS
jgi:hypothetical protein